MLSSDHAPHRKGDGGDDEAANPCGVPYLDKAGSLLANWIVHGLNARRAAHISSHGPAKLMGLDDRGLISEGMRADLAVLRLYGDGRSDKTYSLCGWTPYGYVQDFVEATIIGGKVVFERGEPVGI